MKILTLFLLAAAALPAQETRVIAVKYADVARLKEVLAVFGARVSADRNLQLIAVSGPKEVVDAMESAVKRLDVPPPVTRNVELTVTLLLATNKTVESPVALPKDLEPVLKQMRGLFAYKEYRPLDTLLLRARDGERVIGEGVVPVGESKDGGSYNLSVSRVTVGEQVRLSGISFTIRVPTGNSFREIKIATDTDVRENQKVVIGKANIDASGDALILVLSAKIVD